MSQPCELIEIVSLIAKLLVQLSEIGINNDPSVSAHIQNELAHGRCYGLIHTLLQGILFFGCYPNRYGFGLCSSQ